MLKILSSALSAYLLAFSDHHQSSLTPISPSPPTNRLPPFSFSSPSFSLLPSPLHLRNSNRFSAGARLLNRAFSKSAFPGARAQSGVYDPFDLLYEPPPPPPSAIAVVCVTTPRLPFGFFSRSLSLLFFLLDCRRERVREKSGSRGRRLSCIRFFMEKWRWGRRGGGWCWCCWFLI